jgi:hypothetical protein
MRAHGWNSHRHYDFMFLLSVFEPRRQIELIEEQALAISEKIFPYAECLCYDHVLRL